MAKKLEIALAKAGDAGTTSNSPKFHNLEPRNYRLQCRWFAESKSTSRDWTGALTTPEFNFAFR